jgi:hypothetical protein
MKTSRILQLHNLMRNLAVEFTKECAQPYGKTPKQLDQFADLRDSVTNLAWKLQEMHNEASSDLSGTKSSSTNGFGVSHDFESGGDEGSDVPRGACAFG